MKVQFSDVGTLPETFFLIALPLSDPGVLSSLLRLNLQQKAWSFMRFRKATQQGLCVDIVIAQPCFPEVETIYKYFNKTAQERARKEVQGIHETSTPNESAKHSGERKDTVAL